MHCISRTLVVLGALLAAAGPARAAPVSGQLRVYILNIGQGGAILIICPHGTHRLLIDSGDHRYPGSQAAFKALLLKLVGAGGTINVVVASHPHADHVGGLDWVLSTFRVKKFIDNGRAYTSMFAKIRTHAQSLVAQGRLKYFAGNKFPAASIADFCPASNVKAELLIPDEFGTASNENNNSVGVLVRYNDVKLLFTGDAEKAEEGLLLADPVVANKIQGATFYKVGHHGSETSSTPALLNTLQLRVAAISAGCKDIHPNTGHRHPREVVLERLQTLMAPGPNRTPRQTPAGLQTKNRWTTFTLEEQIYVTPVDGTVEVVSDGQGVQRVASSVTDPLEACH